MATRHEQSGMKLPVDVDVLREEIRKTYTDVSIDHDAEFIFPTGRWWAEELGYPQPELGRVPDATVESFAGVANPFSLGYIEPGATVLDLGCGSGFDTLIAAQQVGPSGRMIAMEMTAAMRQRTRELLAEFRALRAAVLRLYEASGASDLAGSRQEGQHVAIKLFGNLRQPVIRLDHNITFANDFFLGQAGRRRERE